jgi:DNA-binding GntR family transcriptional regulator
VISYIVYRTSLDYIRFPGVTSLASVHQLDQPSAARTIARWIREQIRSGALRPGNRLAVAELAGRHGVRLSILTEALWRLVDDRLLTLYGGTAVVTALDPNELAEIAHLRHDVGLSLSEHAYRCMSPAELDRVESRLLVATEPALVSTAEHPGGNATVWSKAMCEFNLRLARPGATILELQAFSYVLLTYRRYKALGWATIFQNHSAGVVLGLRREHLGHCLDFVNSFRTGSSMAVRDAGAQHENDGYSIGSASLIPEYTSPGDLGPAARSSTRVPPLGDYSPARDTTIGRHRCHSAGAGHLRLI